MWTTSLTVAAQIQQEAMDKEGPLHGEELCHSLETVLQCLQPRKAAQRLRDTADELVAPLEHS